MKQYSSKIASRIKQKIEFLEKKIQLQILFVIILAPGIFSCQSYYKIQKTSVVKPRTLKKLHSKDKYFVLHLADTSVRLENVQIERYFLVGNPKILALKQDSIHYPAPDSSLNEVHVYANYKVEEGDSTIRLPMKDILRLEYYKRQHVKNKCNKDDEVWLDVAYVALKLISLPFRILALSPFESGTKHHESHIEKRPRKVNLTAYKTKH